MVLWLLFSVCVCLCVCVRCYIYACLFLQYFVFFWLLLYFFLQKLFKLDDVRRIHHNYRIRFRSLFVNDNTTLFCVRSLFVFCFLISFNDKKAKENLFFESLKTFFLPSLYRRHKCRVLLFIYSNLCGCCYYFRQTWQVKIVCLFVRLFCLYLSVVIILTIVIVNRIKK